MNTHYPNGKIDTLLKAKKRKKHGVVATVVSITVLLHITAAIIAAAMIIAQDPPEEDVVLEAVIVEPVKSMVSHIKRAYGSKAVPVINTIGLEVGGKEDSGSQKHLIDIAALGKGEAVFLTGEEYIKEHGEDKKHDWQNPEAMWEKDDKVEWDEKFGKDDKRRTKYYAEFSLLKKKVDEVAQK